MTSDADMVYAKVALNMIYIFVADNFFIWDHLGAKIFVLSYLVWIFQTTLEDDMVRTMLIDLNSNTNMYLTTFLWWSFGGPNVRFRLSDFEIYFFYSFKQSWMEKWSTPKFIVLNEI